MIFHQTGTSEEEGKKILNLEILHFFTDVGWKWKEFTPVCQDVTLGRSFDTLASVSPS